MSLSKFSEIKNLHKYTVICVDIQTSSSEIQIATFQIICSKDWKRSDLQRGIYDWSEFGGEPANQCG